MNSVPIHGLIRIATGGSPPAGGGMGRIGSAVLAEALAEQRREIAQMRQELARLSDRTVGVERLQRRAKPVRNVGFDKLDALLRQGYLTDLSSDAFPSG